MASKLHAVSLRYCQVDALTWKNRNYLHMRQRGVDHLRYVVYYENRRRVRKLMRFAILSAPQDLGDLR